MAWSAKGKVTRRERFLAQRDAVIPWARLLALIEPHYPKAGNGRQSVDATVITASGSTKNEAKARDPEMSSTKKGVNWHFGMKVHLGSGRRGLVHTVTTTTTRVNDFTQSPDRLHGAEREVYGDRDHWSEEPRWLGGLRWGWHRQWPHDCRQFRSGISARQLAQRFLNSS